MSHSHTLNSEEELEREGDLHKKEARGEDFKNRLETIKKLGIENGVQSDEEVGEGDEGYIYE